MELADKLFSNAELVRNLAQEQLEANVGYDEAAMRWFDEYVTRRHLHGGDEQKAKLINTLGSFFGECILKTHGGKWVTSPDSQYPLIEFSQGNVVYPFNKVDKHLRDGPDESVLALFMSIAPLFAQKSRIDPPPDKQKPFWKFF
jgi:hypothetical protein